ncbi:hypothetical protein ACKC9G_04655 [Pokkaliibacter sp. CJK22405]|uniref:hypothetical protein n=1 Tax=Pokkaliibacter sp. CJK22405 TaxID=3384615 RepID=UPI003984FF40
MSTIWIGASSLADKAFHKWVGLYDQPKPRVILDNDPAKQGSTRQGVSVDLVANVQRYLEGNDAEARLILTSSYARELRAQLLALGVPERQIVDFYDHDAQVDGGLLSRNALLKSRTQGKRCVIVGNGPSLNQIDLSQLMPLDCICVNHAYKSEAILSLQPRFWVVADPLFWQQAELHLDPVFDVLQTHLPEARLLINADAIFSFDRSRAMSEQVYYFDMSLPRPETVLASCDFESRMPLCAQNVLCPALMLAIYLGYEEILLAGFDHTWWSYTREDIAAGKVIPHAYQHTSSDNKISTDAYADLGYEGLRATIAQQQQEYGLIRTYAQTLGRRIISITPGEMTCFPYQRFDDVFSAGVVEDGKPC